MKRNAIILTSGLTGSSVLAGLISKAGYWTGDSTHKKKEYDTYENEELIALNLRIFQQAQYTENYLTQFSLEAVDRFKSLRPGPGDDIYREFVRKCEAHRPWVWKDPRLWLTMPFWKHFLNPEECRFIVLTRGFRQLWVSTTLRRQIVDYRVSRRYEQAVRDSAIEFLKANNLPYLTVAYEDLIVHPVETISKLNGWLGTELTLDDLKSFYHKPLYKVPGSSPLDFVKAVLIYLKNYSERLHVPQTPVVQKPRS